MGRAWPWSLSDADRGVRPPAARGSPGRQHRSGTSLSDQTSTSEDGGERVDAPAFDVYRDTAGPCVSCTPYSCHRDNVAGDSRLTGPEDRTMSDSYEFATHGFCKSMASGTHGGYAPLRRLVQPYVLRRLKTDKSVIADLPDKTEVTAHCLLSKRQAALYTQSVEAMKTTIEALDGIERRGVVLAFLMRFKQICNHPSQWLGDGSYAARSSCFCSFRNSMFK